MHFGSVNWGCSSVVERLLCMQKVLGSKPSLSTSFFSFLLLFVFVVSLPCTFDRLSERELE